MKSVLVLSGHVVSLGVVRALAKAGIPVFVASYDDRDMAPFSRYVQGTIQVPHPSISEAEFAACLERWGRQHDGCVLIPADDASLVAASRYHETLSHWFLVACPPREVVNRVIDKRTTYAIAGGAGVPVPRTLTPGSAQETADAADEMGYPCLVKPAISHIYFERYGVKHRRVGSRDEARRAFVETRQAGVDVMVQELIPGRDDRGVNYNAYVIDGTIRVDFTARKVRMAPPGGGVPSVVVSEKVTGVVELGRRTVQAIGFNGYACCEFKWDSRTEVYKLLEVNGRHNRSTLLSTRCGINFPLIEYDYLVRGILPEPKDFKTSVYWIDEFKDAMYASKRIRADASSLLTFWRPYLPFPVWAVFDRRDPRPFGRRVGHGVAAFLERRSPGWRAIR